MCQVQRQFKGSFETTNGGGGRKIVCHHKVKCFVRQCHQQFRLIQSLIFVDGKHLSCVTVHVQYIRLFSFKLFGVLIKVGNNYKSSLNPDMIKVISVSMAL